MATRDDVNTPVIAVVGLISALVFFASILLLQVMFYRIEARQRYEKDISQPPAELTALVQRQQARLAEYRWVDEKKRIAAIPIERAMELVVANPSKSAEPVITKDEREKAKDNKGKAKDDKERAKDKNQEEKGQKDGKKEGKQ
jgi:hypothetical protein